jgi:hypothetical protein
MSMLDSGMLSFDRGLVAVVVWTSWSAAVAQLLAMAVVESTVSPSGIYLLRRLAPETRDGGQGFMGEIGYGAWFRR